MDPIEATSALAAAARDLQLFVQSLKPRGDRADRRRSRRKVREADLLDFARSVLTFTEVSSETVRLLVGALQRLDDERGKLERQVDELSGRVESLEGAGHA